MSRQLCDAAAFAKLHYNTERNLACVTPKTSRLVLRDPYLDSGVGTFLLRIALFASMLALVSFFVVLHQQFIFLYVAWSSSPSVGV